MDNLFFVFDAGMITGALCMFAGWWVGRMVARRERGGK